ncbi:hypothetical protein G8T75_12755 [Clostridium botulinum D/C]|uniref:hypothetical protein n=1 Tax=Clostridium botulinum TaxID=1491 RepID=UPI001E52B142|nr:hypothetical protein [Clostridium botulinum]MCD3240827.1 hypothetical protein [Clostridium botulinum D/C]
MANYKTNLIEEELNKLNLIENESIRKSCMSILSYLIKKHIEENKKYIDTNLENLKDQSTFKISFRTFLKKYNRSHKKLSLGTLKNRIDLLLKYELIHLESKSTYSFFRHSLNKNLNKNLNKENIAESINNTDVDAVVAEHKYLNTKINNIKDLDTFNSKQVTESVDNFDYESYLEQNKKCDNWDYVLNLLNKAFKAMKIKSQAIKGIVISKVYDYYTNITRKHAMSYITKTIINARDNYYKKHTQYYFNNSNPNTDLFNDYEQRSYDYVVLEKQLLGLI